MDPRIGQLNNGHYYAYVHGYDQAPVFGSLSDVEKALGIQPSKSVSQKPPQSFTYTVTLRFEYPAWDEMDGIHYVGIDATCKSNAIKAVRLLAEADGHCQRGKGRYWFCANVCESER